MHCERLTNKFQWARCIAIGMSGCKMKSTNGEYEFKTQRFENNSHLREVIE